MNEKLLRGNYTVMLAYPEYAVDPLNPTLAELNDQFAYGTNEDAMVFNISCAILDDANDINQADSDTDSTMTICDVAALETPTFQNYTITFDTLRDRDVDAQGVFNLAYYLTITADRPYYVITRVGATNTEPFTATDHLSIFGGATDNPVPVIDDNAPVVHGARFTTNGKFNINTQAA